MNVTIIQNKNSLRTWVWVCKWNLINILVKIVVEEESWNIQHAHEETWQISQMLPNQELCCGLWYHPRWEQAKWKSVVLKQSIAIGCSISHTTTSPFFKRGFSCFMQPYQQQTWPLQDPKWHQQSDSCTLSTQGHWQGLIFKRNGGNGATKEGLRLRYWHYNAEAAPLEVHQGIYLDFGWAWT